MSNKNGLPVGASFLLFLVLSFCGFCWFWVSLLVLGRVAVADGLLLAGLVVASKGSLNALLIEAPEAIRLRVAQIVVAVDGEAHERGVGHCRLGNSLDGLLGEHLLGRRSGGRDGGRDGRRRLLCRSRSRSRSRSLL